MADINDNNGVINNYNNTITRTTSTTLQAKLVQLKEFADQDNRVAFVDAFVPLDLSESDKQLFLQDLTSTSSESEADKEWCNLVSEISALVEGKGVHRISGDQVTEATFYFEHPILKQCDREVTFVCVGGEWRADG